MAEHRTLRKNTEGRVGIYTRQALEEMQIRTLDDLVSQREGPQTAQVTLHWQLTLLSFPSAPFFPSSSHLLGQHAAVIGMYCVRVQSKYLRLAMTLLQFA